MPSAELFYFWFSKRIRLTKSCKKTEKNISNDVKTWMLQEICFSSAAEFLPSFLTRLNFLQPLTRAPPFGQNIYPGSTPWKLKTKWKQNENNRKCVFVCEPDKILFRYFITMSIPGTFCSVFAYHSHVRIEYLNRIRGKVDWLKRSSLHNYICDRSTFAIGSLSMKGLGGEHLT